ncbi:MAG: hypothetical protein D6722_13315 [Bacteroidetes bacterium]|nr:MAG: hypothetical protein D6722_13315 [Bacteroidota bacterium]
MDNRQESDRFLRRRVRSTYLTAMGSIALVLYFLGIFAGLALFGRAVMRDVQQQAGLKVFLHEGVRQDRLAELETRLQRAPYVTEVSFISRQAAAERMAREAGPELQAMLAESNPFPDAFHLAVHPAYLRSDSLEAIRARLEGELLVAEVTYRGELLDTVNRNLRMFGLIALILGVILSLIALWLIISTVRLTVFAQRLTIRAMQLVGATRGFILRPYVWRGLSQGGLGGLLAAILLGATGWGLWPFLEESGLSLKALPVEGFIGLLGGIVLFGLALGGVGSYLAVRRYLNRSLDELM